MSSMPEAPMAEKDQKSSSKRSKNLQRSIEGLSHDLRQLTQSLQVLTQSLADHSQLIFQHSKLLAEDMGAKGWDQGLLYQGPGSTVVEEVKEREVKEKEEREMKEREEKEREEQARLVKEKEERERQEREKERQERERQAREKQERELLEKEKQEKEKQETQKQQKDKQKQSFPMSAVKFIVIDSDSEDEQPRAPKGKKRTATEAQLETANNTRSSSPSPHRSGGSVSSNATSVSPVISNMDRGVQNVTTNGANPQDKDADDTVPLAKLVKSKSSGKSVAKDNDMVWESTEVIPSNKAFLGNNIFTDDSPRDPLSPRIRYLRGPAFKYKRDGFTLKYHGKPNSIFDPEYTIVRNLDSSDRRLGKTGAVKEGLCPFCPQVKFYKISSASYSAHMVSEHGINNDQYVIPDPFLSSKPADPKFRLLVCPVCAKDIRVGAKGLGGSKSFAGYLTHFKEEHCKAKGTSELDRFRRRR